MKNFKLLLIAFLVSTLFLGCSKESKTTTTQKQSDIKQNRQKFEFILKDINGTTITFNATESGLKSKELENKIIFLDFFATWCPPCKAEIPHLVNLQKKYKDKLVIIGILLEKDKNIGELKRFKDEYKINYFISNSSDNFELAKIVYAAVQAPRNMPIPLMVIFKNGEYKTHYLGAVPEEMIESDIKNILGE